MSHFSIDSVTVLHVDDEPDFGEIVAEFLEREDAAFSVRTATSVDDALTVLRNESIECVVSDYDMPDRDGLELLELVRDDYPDLPFILFTGKGSEEIASQAISAGVTDYLQKGVGTEQYTVLANRIRNAVRSTRAETAVQRTEDRYHNLVDTAPIPILLFDRNWEALYANEAAVAFLDADSFAEIAGKKASDFLHPDERDTARERFQQLIRDDVSVPEKEYRVITVTDEVKEATIATAPGYYRGEKVAQAMVYR
ncbi:response regulator [Haloarcula sp. CBA1130]|uniref:response regulator n=1 Tax=unclassified Haloarcula TaxID=2624677 RepID=UPI00124837F6|nr:MULTISPECIES: response regulator [unclassified Haloarcula]KAA9396999.1 response regulator [Haloarcula sp. CBA1129]KAA9402964.1 response regulator [Haloarcula sp. CBA1130]